MRTTHRVGWVVVALAVLSGSTACSRSTAQSAPTLRSVTCPSDVEVQLVAPHACFRMAVPIDRRHPTGAQVSLFVLRLTPPGVASPDPMLDLGADIGNAPEYGGMAPLPARVHRVTYILDPRGSAHSTPSLACPEALSVTALSRDEGTALAAAARACLARLRAHGLDPALFGPADVAADAVDLRKALGVARWNVITFGSTSTYADALVQRDSGATRSLVEDSPAPSSTWQASSSASTAWDELVAECLADAGCHQTFPGVAGFWRTASARLQSAPLAVSGGDIDPTVLTRVVSAVMSRDGPDSPGLLPGDLTAMINASVPSDVADILAGDSAACVGYRPECQDEVSLGALLTSTCAAQTFIATDVYAKTCALWPRPTPPVTGASKVPTLILYGALDPFVDATGLLSRGRGNTFVVRIPRQTHNTLGYDECPISLRNAWVDHPAAAPDTACLPQIPALAFVTSG